ncbi:MFS transporter [Streptomyces sp. NPDC021020]|uniref:MFS transporter n=1 Tax=Streptomyces sp. NPDC021020 TaxID=3365109 RepID=UPI00378CE059
MAASEAGLRTFAVLWAGQFVSVAGTALSSFALGVYAYHRSGSVTVLALIYALSSLPMILVSPFTGPLVDRWGARRSLTVGNLCSAAVMLALAVLLITHTFATWHIFVAVVCLSAIGGLESPAFQTSVPLLVPKEQLGRANGMRMAATATSQVLAPVAAGALLLAIGIGGILLMDFVSYGAALISLAVVRIPHAEGGPPPARGASSLLADFRRAWRYVADRPGLLALMVFLGAFNFCAGFVDLLITPLVLAFASSDALGAVMTVGGTGMVAASLAMSAWGGPRRRIDGVLGFSFVIGAATVIGSLRPNVPLIAASAFVLLGSLAVVVGCNQTIWQSKVEPRMLGRVMALLNMVSSAPQLLSYAVAGVAVDHVFQPLVGRDRVRSPTVAALVGHGPGRGVALLLTVMGVLVVAVAAAAYSHPRLRRLETEIPDATEQEPLVPDDPPPVPTPTPSVSAETTP